MEFIKNYVIVLAAYIFISSVIKNLLPEGGIKTAVSAVMGIILAALTVSPFLNMDYENSDIFSAVGEYKIYNSDIEQMHQLSEDSMDAMIKRTLTEQIENLLSEHDVKNCVEVILSGENTLSKVVINKDISLTQAMAAEILGLTEDVVEIRR